MAKFYVAPIDIADAGTDADQDIFVGAVGASEKVDLIGFIIHSDKTAAAPIKLELVERSTGGTGGTAITEEDKDRAQDSVSTCAITTDVETPGTGTAVFENFIYEQLGPLEYKPVPEERYTFDVSTFFALNSLTSWVNAAIGGSVCWMEH